MQVTSSFKDHDSARAQIGYHIIAINGHHH